MAAALPPATGGGSSGGAPTAAAQQPRQIDQSALAAADRNAPQDLLKAFFSQDQDVVDVLGVESGLLRLTKVFELYELKPSPTHVSFFDEKGNRQIFRDACNQRKQESVKEELMSSIADRGLVPGVAGEPWLCCSDGEVPPYHALTLGGRSGAIYELAEKQPTNPQVMETIKGGIMARRFTSKMPKWLRVWLRDYHNNSVFQRGSTYSYIEFLKEIPEMEASWHAAKEGHVTARSGNYEQAYWKHIKDRYGDKVTSWAQFDSAKCLYRKLLKLEVLHDHFEWAEQHVEFMNSRISQHIVISNMHAIANFIVAKFDGYMSPLNLRVLVGESIKFVVPCRPSSQQRRIPWLFDAGGASVTERLQYLCFPLDKDSQVYKKSVAKTKAKAKAKPKGGKAAKAKAKASAQQDSAAPADLPPVESMSLELKSDLDMSSARERFFGDDLLMAVDSAVEAACKRPERFEEGVKKIKGELVNIGLEFLWRKDKKVYFKGCHWAAWSLLRKTLQESARDAAEKLILWADGDDDEETPAGDAAAAAAAGPEKSRAPNPNAILKALVTSAAVDASSDPQKKMDDSLQVHYKDDFRKLEEFVSTNRALKLKANLQQFYPQLLNNILQKLPDQTMALPAFLCGILSGVNELGVFTVSCVDMIVNVFAHVNDTCEMPVAFGTMCKSGGADLAKLMHFRGELTSCLIKDLIDSKPIGEFHHSDGDGAALPAQAVKAFIAKISEKDLIEVYASDAMQRGEQEWVGFWDVLIKGGVGGGKIAAILGVATSVGSRKLKRERSIRDGAQGGGGSAAGAVQADQHNKLLVKVSDLYVCAAPTAQCHDFVRLISGPALKYIESQLTAHIWKLHRLAHLSGGAASAADNVSVDVSGQKPKTACLASKPVDLIFAAPVTFVKGRANFMPLCSLFSGNFEMFLNGTAVNTNASDMIVPAWGINVVDKQADSNVQTLFLVETVYATVGFDLYFTDIAIMSEPDRENPSDGGGRPRDDAPAQPPAKKAKQSEGVAGTGDSGMAPVVGPGPNAADADSTFLEVLGPSQDEVPTGVTLYAFKVSIPFARYQPEPPQQGAPPSAPDAVTYLKRMLTPDEAEAKRRQRATASAAQAAAASSDTASSALAGTGGVIARVREQQGGGDSLQPGGKPVSSDVDKSLKAACRHLTK